MHLFIHFRYVNCDFEIEGQILKMALPQKNGHRIKTPSSKLTILVSSCWEKNFIRNNTHNFFILSLVFLKLLIVTVAFFLGHHIYPTTCIARDTINRPTRGVAMGVGAGGGGGLCPRCHPTKIFLNVNQMEKMCPHWKNPSYATDRYQYNFLK